MDVLFPIYWLKYVDVLFVSGIENGASILIALDIKRESAVHNKLNEAVIDFGKALAAGIPNSSLHAVNAYANSDSFIYPIDLAEIAGIDRTNAHAVEGAPDKVIPEIAKKIDASIVVVGTAARQGLKAAVIGNTAEKILDALNTNILTVNVNT